MTPVRLGSVGYLNARPLVFGLDDDPRFEVRYDTPAESARLLHARAIDVGLIPSIEYLRGPVPYVLVPGLGVTSKGPVASVAVYTRKDPRDIRSIAMDSSSRTSVALTTVLMRRVYGVQLEPTVMGPDLERMLQGSDAALIIGDEALFADHVAARAQKIDLGELWTAHTGLPFVYACWTGWPAALSAEDVEVLERARDQGVAHADEVARRHYPDDPTRRRVAERYLRDNVHYFLGPEEMEGLRRFFTYAAELQLVTFDGAMRVYDVAYHEAR